MTDQQQQQQTTAAKKEELFPKLGEVADRTDAADDDVPEGSRDMQEVESMCMRCHENGKTRLLLTTIPYFKEIIVSSFLCDHCGYRDTEIQSAGEIQPKGAMYTVHLLSRDDLQRQIVKSNWATVAVPDLQLTIPPGRGQLTTVEGLLRDTVRDLSIEQPVRRIMDPPTAKKIDDLLSPIRDMLDMAEGDEEGEVGRDGPAVQHEGEGAHKPFQPFTLTLDDPSGNSFVAFKDSTNDPQWNLRAYNRTFEQNVTLGLVSAEDGGKAADASAVPDDHRKHSAEEAMASINALEHGDGSVAPDEVFTFPSTCSSCGHTLETRMQQIRIPYFDDVIIMSATCPTCGYKDNEVKSGGRIKPLGKRITLKVEKGDEDALSRDLLKSDTCGLEIPEIDLKLQPGTLGGRFTTLEGILNEIYDELSTKVFRTGDSATAGIGQQGQEETITKETRNFEAFLAGLKSAMAVERDFTVILDDPLSNSYLQNLNAPEPDPDMVIEEYERSKEQNDDLGLSDIKVENYNPDIKDKL